MPMRSQYSDAREYNKALCEEFRTHGGVVTGDFADRPLLLLTTIGAKSGNQYTTPLVYSSDGDRLVVAAAAGGAPKHPGWYHNLVANPNVTVELPGESFEARAVVSSGEERERLVAERTASSPTFGTYQEKAGREIPLVLLERH